MAQGNLQEAAFHTNDAGEVIRVVVVITPTVAKVFYHTVLEDQDLSLAQV